LARLFVLEGTGVLMLLCHVGIFFLLLIAYEVNHPSSLSQFLRQFVDSYWKSILIYNIAASIASKAVLSKINSLWNSAFFRIYDVSGEQLHLVQLYTNSLPLHTQVSVCSRKCLLA